MSDIEKEHSKYVQEVYDTLPDSLKIELRRYAPFDRIHLKRIGIPSAIASVYDVDGYGELVVKLNSYNDDNNKVMASNNSAIDNELRKYMNIINNNSTYAKIAVSQHKVIHGNYVITFERKMEGRTLQEYLIQNSVLDAGKLIEMFKKIKTTLIYLYDKIGFIHHDLHCGNVFLQDDFTPIIFDFDWAVALKKYFPQANSQGSTSQASNSQANNQANIQANSLMNTGGSSSPMIISGSTSSMNVSPVAPFTNRVQQNSVVLSTEYTSNNFMDMQIIFTHIMFSRLGHLMLNNRNYIYDIHNSLINKLKQDTSTICNNINNFELWWYIINFSYSRYNPSSIFPDMSEDEKNKKCDMTLLLFHFVWICCNYRNGQVPNINIATNNLLTLDLTASSTTTLTR